MPKILFATGNPHKLKEAHLICKDFGIEVEQLSIHIDEIQHHDPLEIAKKKAEEAYNQAGAPIVINDAFWSIPALNGFPGGYMKDVANWFSPEDFLALMTNKTDRTIICTETIIYKDASETKIFSKNYPGTIAENARGTGNSINQLVQLNGNSLTIAECRDKNIHDTFVSDDSTWSAFAEWYQSKTA